jgi:protein tyrosine/serine phosphatase
MSKRIHAFTGINNFRDYGDYVTAAGRKVKSGKLFRSANLSQATDSDLAAFAALDIAHVVDLRRPGERLREPSRFPQGFAGQVIENDTGDQVDAPHMEVLRASGLNEEAVRDHMLNYYTHAPFEDRHIDLFSRYFQAVASGKGAVLIHCAAGKDRTGMLAAFTHHVLGVHRDDVMEDYLLTNVAARIEERVPTATEMVKGYFGGEPTPEAVKAFLGVEASYLERAFEMIEDRYSSLDDYLVKVLGVDDAMRDKVAHRLLA